MTTRVGQASLKRSMSRRCRSICIAIICAALLVSVDGYRWASSKALAQSAIIAGPAADNLLRNSGFDGTDYWILKGEGTSYVEAGGLEGGAVEMRDADLEYELVQTIGPELKPGVRYTLSAWTKALSDDAEVTLGVRYAGGYPRAFRGVNEREGWVRMEFWFEAPEEPGWRQVVLGGSGDFLWDSIVLYESESVEAQLAKQWEARMREGEEVYTGLIINGLGSGLERGMNPKIYDEDGQLIFAGIGADESRLFTQGLVAYARELQEGAAHPRLRVSEAYPFSLPLIINVKDVAGFPATDAIIDNYDAERIKEAVAHYDFLGRFAIVFVVDPVFGL